MFRIFDVDPEKFSYTYECFRAAVHPEDRDFVDKSAKDSFDSKKDFHLRFRVLTRLGTLKYVDGHGKVTFDQKTGQPLRMTGVNQDVTEVVRLEQEKVEQAKKKQALQERAQMAEVHQRENLVMKPYDSGV